MIKKEKFKKNDKVIYQVFNNNVGSMYGCIGSEIEATIIDLKKSDKNDTFNYILKTQDNNIIEINEKFLNKKIISKKGKIKK